MNGSHVSSVCVNSRQICDDILRDLNLVMSGNVESYPDLSSVVAQRNVLERRPQRLPALYGGTTEITEGSILLFLVLACSIPPDGGRLGPKCLAWTAMLFTPCDAPASEKVSYSLSMLSHSSELLT